jgi:hypothetical protein
VLLLELLCKKRLDFYSTVVRYACIYRPSGPVSLCGNGPSRAFQGVPPLTNADKSGLPGPSRAFHATGGAPCNNSPGAPGTQILSLQDLLLGSWGIQEGTKAYISRAISIVDRSFVFNSNSISYILVTI